MGLNRIEAQLHPQSLEDLLSWLPDEFSETQKTQFLQTVLAGFLSKLPASLSLPERQRSALEEVAHVVCALDEASLRMYAREVLGYSKLKTGHSTGENRMKSFTIHDVEIPNELEPLIAGLPDEFSEKQKRLFLRKLFKDALKREDAGEDAILVDHQNQAIDQVQRICANSHAILEVFICESLNIPRKAEPRGRYERIAMHIMQRTHELITAEMN